MASVKETPGPLGTDGVRRRGCAERRPGASPDPAGPRILWEGPAPPERAGSRREGRTTAGTVCARLAHVRPVSQSQGFVQPRGQRPAPLCDRADLPYIPARPIVDPRNFSAQLRGPVALQLQPRPGFGRADVQTTATGTEGVRDLLDRIVTSYEEIDRRFAAAGGLGSLLNLYEQVRRELERVSYEELDRMTREIKSVIEGLLKMDYELRKVHNLKLAFDARQAGSSSAG